MIKLTKAQYIVSRLTCNVANAYVIYRLFGETGLGYLAFFVALVGWFVSSETKD